jgi:dienelactone hydrolase
MFDFAAKQNSRRESLYRLLGDLPHNHVPPPAKLIRTEKHDGFTLERLLLDLNGVEPVPAILLIPDRRAAKSPGMLFVHWHGDQYDLGKEQLLKGTVVQPAYAPVCAEIGIVTLAIDSWCFGERQHDSYGQRGEQDTFKRALWNGQTLWGMMLFDEIQALGYLASRPQVDANRLCAFGISMGATKAWWLAALDERIALTIDLCCLTDYDALIAHNNLSGHGVYYYIPGLLREFSAAQINELIVPRPRLSLNGRRDPLTPPEGVQKIRDHLYPLYGSRGRTDDCRIELFDCAHEETPEMRSQVIAWLSKRLCARP